MSDKHDFEETRKPFMTTFNTMPLVTFMALNRFSVILEENLNLFSPNGLTINGINVSTNYKLDKSAYTALYNMKKLQEFNLTHYISKYDTSGMDIAFKTRHDSASYYVYSLVQNLYVIDDKKNGVDAPFTSIPTMLVADKEGTPYLLYNKFSNSFITPLKSRLDSFKSQNLSDASESGFGLVPFNEDILVRLKENIESDPLAVALSTIKSYDLVDVSSKNTSSNGNKLISYMTDTLNNFGMDGYKTIKLSQDFITVPLANVSISNIDKSLEIKGKCVAKTYSDSGKRMMVHKEYEKDDTILVLLNQDTFANRVYIQNNTSFVSINGKLCDIQCKPDITYTGESKSLGEAKIIDTVTYDEEELYYGVSVMDNNRFILTSESCNIDDVVLAYESIKLSMDKALTKETKTKEEKRLVSYAFYEALDKQKYFTEKQAENAHKLFSKIKKDVKTLSSDKINNLISVAISKCIKECYDRKQYESIIHLNNLKQLYY